MSKDKKERKTRTSQRDNPVSDVESITVRVFQDELLALGAYGGTVREAQVAVRHALGVASPERSRSTNLSAFRDAFRDASPEKQAKIMLLLNKA